MDQPPKVAKPARGQLNREVKRSCRFIRAKHIYMYWYSSTGVCIGLCTRYIFIWGHVVHGSLVSSNMHIYIYNIYTCVNTVVCASCRPMFVYMAFTTGQGSPPVQHLLRGGYKLGLHAFQGGRRHHGRFGPPEEEKGSGGGGGAEGSNCRRVSPRDAALRYALR